MAKTRNSRTKTKAKNPLSKKITNIATKVFIYFLLVSVFWVIALRFINPPITLLMVLRNIERKADGKSFKTEKKWVKFD
ncbi:MAG: monofunctional biosynthetic peptidoglycan transglycosylase, partial [Chitinophagaceae bacterium]